MALGMFVLWVSPCPASIVIHEIHYEPEDNTQPGEFVELYNRGEAPVDLSGWALTDGIDYTFPPETNLLPGEFLLVAEDPAFILANHSVAALGPFSGSLSNEGENLELSDALGAVVDAVDYRVEFPWPLDSAGQGSSMELVNPSLDNNLGGSWRPSAGAPTPGAINSVYADNAPPQIRQVNHKPDQPLSNQPTVITVKATDPEGILSVAVLYQIVEPGNYVPAFFPLNVPQLLADADQPRAPNPAFEDLANWIEVPMTDNGSGDDAIPGDHVFTATLPEQPNRTLVRYRIVAADAATPSVSIRAPFPDDPSLNFAYFVYDGVPPYEPTTQTVHPEGLGHVYGPEIMNSLPVYFLLTRVPDLSTCIAYFNTLQIPSSNRAARSSFNWEGAFVYDGVVYDHMHYRLRGHNQRYQLRQKRNMRFRFNRGLYFQARDQKGREYPTKWRTMLFCKMFGPRNVGNFGITESINNHLFNLVGVPAPFTHFIHFRAVDGIEESPSGPNGQYEGDFWGMALAMEDYDSRFLDAHGLPKANLYKLTDGQTDGKIQQRYQAQDAVSNAEDYNNIVANLHPASSEDFLRTYVDYEYWYRYETVQQAIRHYDLGVYPDREDFFAPVDTPALKNIAWFFHPDPGNPFGKLRPMPWDHEQSWGENGAHQGWDMPLYAMIDPQITDGRAKVDYTGGPRQKESLYIGYRNTLREFRDLVWNDEVLPPMIDRFAAIVEAFVPADRDRWKDHPLNGGTLTDFGTLEDKVADMEVYAFEGGTHWPVLDRPNTSMVAPGGRAAELDERSNYGGDGVSIPATPTVTFTGAPGYFADDLIFETSPFSDPQGPGTFAALKWRLGETTDPDAPAYDPEADPIYEWTEVWSSGEITPFANQIQIPLGAARPGHTYRVRSRMKDDTGRWGHWSAPVEFTVAVESTHSPGDIIVSEFLANATGADDFKEWIELFNTTGSGIDIRGWRIVDNDNDSHTIAAGAPVMVPSKGYLVIGEATDVLTNGGAPVQYAFKNDLTLSNEGDEIVLLEGSTLIHSVGYGSFDPTPHAIQSAIPSPPVQSRAFGLGFDYCNGQSVPWAFQSTPYGTNNDLGTPGADNDGVEVCAPDTGPPRILEGQFAAKNRIVLKFDEPIDATTALDIGNYRIEPGTLSPFGANLESLDTVLLHYGVKFEPDTTYTLHVQNVLDTASNPVAPTETVNLTFSIPAISITEVMLDNRGTDIEWIELFNTTVTPIDVSGWYLTDDDVYPAIGEGNAALPAGTIIDPSEYVVVNLWGDAGFDLWRMPPSIRIVNALPVTTGSLSNEGDNLALFDGAAGGTLIEGSLIAALPNLSVDGESLEKIDERFPWENELAVSYNFASSTSPIGFETGLNENAEFLSSFASPGRRNGSEAEAFATPTSTASRTATPTYSLTETLIPTPTATPFTDAPTETPTLAPETTPTPSNTRDYDIAPTPAGDGEITPNDLLEFLDRIRSGSEEAALLFDFSRFWPNR